MAIENEKETISVIKEHKDHIINIENQGINYNDTLRSDFQNKTDEEQQEETVDAADEVQKPSNTYAAKKTVAQGMMDIALITANANQLRYIIDFNSNSPTFYLNLILIIISLMLQVAIGVSLIFKGRLDLKGESKNVKAKRINNYVVIGIFLVTIINVFSASFTVTGNQTSV